MGYCKSCGKHISSQYLFCYDCNKFAKTYKDKKGYVRFKDSRKPLHRHAVEKKLGRPLKPWERVHHIDRNKANNRWSNLFAFRNQKEHDRVHKIDSHRFGKRVSYRGFRERKKWYQFWK